MNRRDYAQVRATQAGFFNELEAVRLRNVSIERVAAGAGSWLHVAADAVKCVALEHERFTTDDVWARLSAWGVKSPREPRAMGAVMRTARGAGYCEPDQGTPLPSLRPPCHRRPLRVWESRLAGKVAAA